jgi:hypothetical protein
LVFPDTTSSGIGNAHGLSYYRPQDAFGNALLRAGEPGQHLYIDGSTIHLRTPDSDVMTLTSSGITANTTINSTGYTAGNAEFTGLHDFRKTTVSSGSAGYVAWLAIPRDTAWIIIGTPAAASSGLKAVYFVWNVAGTLRAEPLTNQTDSLIQLSWTTVSVYRSPNESMYYHAIRLFTTVLI